MKPTILLIEDEIEAIRAYSEILQDEFEVIWTQSVAEALLVLDKREIAVVVTDMRMPEQNGEDFLRITESRHRRPIKIVLSAFVEDFFDDAFQTRYHIYAILRKPLLNASHFLQVIRKAVAEYLWRFGDKSNSEVRYLSAEEVIGRMGISRPTLYKYLRDGLPSKRVGGRRLFNWEEIRRWVDNQGQDFQTEPPPN